MTRSLLGTRSALIALALVLTVIAAGCSSAKPSDFALKDPYVKAAAAGEMTAIFGTLDNPTDQTLTVVKAHTDVAATTELHEMVTENGSMVMREKKDGFAVPAKGTLELKPGGLHIMLMGLTKALKAGDQVPVTLTLSDGTTVTFTATVRDMTNAQESYSPSPSGHHG